MTRVFVPLEQNSDQWQEWRASVRSASDAPVIMGAAPSYWQKRTWDDLRNPPEREVSEFTRRLWDMGHRREAWYREAHGLPIEPACVQRGDYAASLDGFFEGLGDSWWEIKSVRSGSSRMWTRFPVGMHYSEVREHMLAELPHVWWQLVHQAHVVGLRDVLLSWPSARNSASWRRRSPRRSCLAGLAGVRGAVGAVGRGRSAGPV